MRSEPFVPRSRRDVDGRSGEVEAWTMAYRFTPETYLAKAAEGVDLIRQHTGRLVVLVRGGATMGRIPRVLLATILLGPATQIARCAQAPAPEAKSPPDGSTRERFVALVKQLGSVSYHEREAASEALFDLGPGILDWIIEREDGEPDAEIQQRLEEIRWVLECQIIRTVEDAERAFRRCVESETSLIPLPKHVRLLKILSSREALKALERLCPASEIAKRTADLLFHSGLMWYRRYRPGNADHGPLESARKDMERAVGLYSAWLETHPNDKEAETHLLEANMIFYSCRKFARL